MYRSVVGGWNGSEEDKLRLHEQLESLQKDPTYLSYDTMLPELNNELAPVSAFHTPTHTHTHTHSHHATKFYIIIRFSPQLQMYLVQWMNAAYDYLLQIYDDLLYSNW